ncbi:MAG TPA: methyltransferase domain-containing protein [Pseudonocardia sp.]|nr:methyltransferase domain-containing protein [Pseudonocardia sp.]
MTTRTERPVTTDHPICRNGLAGWATFLNRTARSLNRIGALTPTPVSSARRMAALINPQSDRTVVELGAGTGAISSQIGARLGPGARHIAIEREPDLLAVVARTAPWAERIHADAGALCDTLAEQGIATADVVISSLPWGLFAVDQQHQILDQVTQLLTDDGLFATIVLRPTRLTQRTRAFRASLRESFTDVTISPTLWRNFPPARLYVCRGPRRASSVEDGSSAREGISPTE